MDYENDDNGTNPSDADYFAFIAWLPKLTASEPRETRGDLAKPLSFPCRGRILDTLSDLV